jgi:polyferredoxin
MTDGQAVQRYEPRWNGKVAPTLAWFCALAGVVILAIGLAVQSPWWMLSTPVAVIGAIAGRNSPGSCP